MLKFRFFMLYCPMYLSNVLSNVMSVFITKKQSNRFWFFIKIESFKTFVPSAIRAQNFNRGVFSRFDFITLNSKTKQKLSYLNYVQ